MKPKLVLVGNGMAGGRLLEEIISVAPNLYDITVFGNEPYGNYNRIMLSPLLAGDKALDDIVINSRQWYRDHDITLYAGADKAVANIDRTARRVISEDGTTADYDRLVIATGSSPFMLPIPGVELDGVLGFRDIADVERMIAATQIAKSAVVIGAGLLGLEAAMGLLSRGMSVTVVHSNEVPLNRQLDREAGEMLKAELSDRGLAFKMNARTQAITGRDGRVSHVVFDDGSVLDADLVIMAIGIRPNVALAQNAGVHCENGIVVNDTLQTYDPSIYALGECIQHRDKTFGLVAPLYDQAAVLANHLCEHGVASYQTLSTATKLKVTGINLFSVGDYLGDDTSEALVYRDKANNTYKKLVLRNNQLVGAVLYGDTGDGAYYHDLINSGEAVNDLRPYLVFGRALCESVRESNPEADVA